MPTEAEYATMLTAARTALHNLLTGKEVSVVDYQGRRVTYSPRGANAANDLRAYIRDLEVLSGEKSSRGSGIVVLF